MTRARLVHYMRHMVFGAAALVAAPAAAQTPPPAAPVPADAPPAAPPETPPPAAAAPAADAPPPAPADSARLDDIEQIARVAARKHELLEEEAAKRAKEAPVVVVDDKGFTLKLPDNSYVLKIRALMQADGRFAFDNEALAANDTFLIRRFRPSLEGTLFSLVDYRLLPEFAGSSVIILDAYADFHPWDWLRLRVGKYKGPIGLERLQSDADLPLLERSLDQNLSSQREVGVQLWGDIGGGIAQYTLGVFNGAIDGAATDLDFNHAKDLAGRLFFQPFRAEGLRDFGSLGIGFAASVGNRKGRLPPSTLTGLPAFRTAGQNTFFQYNAPADTTGALTTFAHELETHLNPQLYYYYDAFGLLAEYVLLRQGVQRGNSTAVLNHQSAHATLSYAINGRVGWDGVTPSVPFDRKTGAWGALEIAARYAWLKLDPDTFGTPSVPGSVQYANPLTSAQKAQSWTVGLTWVPRRSVHAAVNFEQTYFKGGAGSATASADRATENVLIFRTQVNF